MAQPKYLTSTSIDSKVIIHKLRREVSLVEQDTIGFLVYSHLSNNRGGWNKRGGVAKLAKSLNVEGGIFLKKLVHKSNKQGVEGEKI